MYSREQKRKRLTKYCTVLLRYWCGAYSVLVRCGSLVRSRFRAVQCTIRTLIAQSLLGDSSN